MYADYNVVSFVLNYRMRVNIPTSHYCTSDVLSQNIWDFRMNVRQLISSRHCIYKIFLLTVYNSNFTNPFLSLLYYHLCGTFSYYDHYWSQCYWTKIVLYFVSHPKYLRQTVQQVKQLYTVAQHGGKNMAAISKRLTRLKPIKTQQPQGPTKSRGKGKREISKGEGAGGCWGTQSARSLGG